MSGAAGRSVQVLADGLSFLEGPRWHGDRLYVSDVFADRVLAFTPDGDMRPVCRVPGHPSGLGFTPDGRLLAVSMTRRALFRLDGAAATSVVEFGAVCGAVANDMVVDAAGRAYVGNFGYSEAEPASVRPTSLLRIDPDGAVAVAAAGLVFPNGMAVTPDGRTILIAETFAGRISAFDIDAAGGLGNRRAWARFGPPPAAGIRVEEAVDQLPVLPDGIALDAAGALWVGDAKGHGPLRVMDGEIVDRIDTGARSVYAVALGGPDRRTLFMCAAPPIGTSDAAVERRAALLACEIDVPGAGRP